MERKLIQYLPGFLRGVKEYAALTGAEQEEVKALRDTVWRVLKNGFVLSSDEAGIRRWENILEMSGTQGEQLEDRRFRILVRLNERLPYTQTVLRQQLETLCGADGYTVKVDVQNYVLSVRVYLSSENRFREVKELTERMTPANMKIDIGLSRKAENRPVYYALTQMHGVKLEVSPDAGNKHLSVQVERTIGVPTLEYVKALYGPAKG